MGTSNAIPDGGHALTDAKRAMRQAMRAQRKALEVTWVMRESDRVQASVLALPEYRAARRVALYLATRGEVCTDAVIRDCRATGKQVSVPAEIERKYDLVEFAADAQLQAGPLAIPQPRERVRVDASRVDFWIVPGLAFDARGGRLGQGGGHYDRMLASAADAFTVGVAFDFQVVAGVPVDDHDVRLQAVVTNVRTIRTQRADGGKGM